MSIYVIPVSKKVTTSAVLFIKGSSLEDARSNLRKMFENNNRAEIVDDYTKDIYDVSSTPWEIQGE